MHICTCVCMCVCDTSKLVKFINKWNGSSDNLDMLKKYITEPLDKRKWKKYKFSQYIIQFHIFNDLIFKFLYTKLICTSFLLLNADFLKH